MSRTYNSAAPLLSIIVPTRNRQEFAANLAQSVIASESSDFELLFHDNSDNDRLGETLAGLDDHRIRYVHSSDAMNMHENFTRAVQVSNGRYVCALGDDDGILIEPALRLLAVAEAGGHDAVRTARYSYLWPGLRHWLLGDVGGQLMSPALRNRTPQVLDPAIERTKVFSNAAVMGIGLLPRLYHGFVTRRCLDDLYERTGSFFPGGSPDLANAVGLSFCVNTILYSDVPVIISGHSAKSGGGAGAAGTHHGDLERQPHLPADTVANWPAQIPRYWSGFTIYAESAYTAARRAARHDDVDIDFSALYAACLVFDGRSYWPRVLAAMRTHPRYGIGLFVATGFKAVGMVWLRAQNFLASLARKLKPATMDDGYSSIADVVAQLTPRRA